MPPAEEPADFAAIAASKAEKAPGGEAAPVQPCGGGGGGGGPAPAPEPIDPTKTWIEIKLVDSTGAPMLNEAYVVTAPGGDTLSGNLDDKGFAHVDGVDPGTCQVSFPRFDRRLWREI